MNCRAQRKTGMVYGVKDSLENSDGKGEMVKVPVLTEHQQISWMYRTASYREMPKLLLIQIDCPA